jgi:hypothetical protein
MLPNRPLICEDIINYIKKLKINHFRGVFSRENLPEKPYNIECVIINLDSSSGSGTHWVSYYRFEDKIIYFDPFGNLPPPIEVQKYFKGDNIIYSYSNFQKHNTYICNHLCLIHMRRCRY